MDELQYYEIPFLVENAPLSFKQQWFQTRYIIWSSLKPYLKNKYAKPEDVFPLIWDEPKELSEKTDLQLSDDDISRWKEIFQKQNQAGK